MEFGQKKFVKLIYLISQVFLPWTFLIFWPTVHLMDICQKWIRTLENTSLKSQNMFIVFITCKKTAQRTKMITLDNNIFEKEKKHLFSYRLIAQIEGQQLDV